MGVPETLQSWPSLGWFHAWPPRASRPPLDGQPVKMADFAFDGGVEIGLAHWITGLGLGLDWIGGRVAEGLARGKGIWSVPNDVFWENGLQQSVGFWTFTQWEGLRLVRRWRGLPRSTFPIWRAGRDVAGSSAIPVVRTRTRWPVHSWVSIWRNSRSSFMVPKPRVG